MPKVNGKKYPYTAAGKAAAKKAKKKGSKIPTPKAKGQKGNAKPQSMKKRKAY